MRVCEIANCRIADILSRKIRIKVVHVKGTKDRYTIMSQQVLRNSELTILNPKNASTTDLSPAKSTAFALFKSRWKKRYKKWALKARLYDI